MREDCSDDLVEREIDDDIWRVLEIERFVTLVEAFSVELARIIVVSAAEISSRDRRR